MLRRSASPFALLLLALAFARFPLMWTKPNRSLPGITVLGKLQKQLVVLKAVPWPLLLRHQLYNETEEEDSFSV